MKRLEIPNNICFNDISSAGDMFCSLIGDRTYETVLAAYLDDNGGLLGVFEISSGMENFVNHSVNDIFQCAYSLSSGKILLAHNHPNGVLQPSLSDIYATSALTETLKFNNMELLAHFIVCGGEYTIVPRKS